MQKTKEQLLQCALDDTETVMFSLRRGLSAKARPTLAQMRAMHQSLSNVKLFINAAKQ